MKINTKPSKTELQLAVGKTVPDLIDHNLKVLFCGINPGLYSAAVGHHFARPGNRFWPALYNAGFTDSLINPFYEEQLLDLGYGITNLVDRATNSAAELSSDELKAGMKNLELKVKKFSPFYVAVLGISAFRTAFNRPKACLGVQEEKINHSKIWVLPNPSGLNAHYTPSSLSTIFKELLQNI